MKKFLLPALMALVCLGAHARRDVQRITSTEDALWQESKIASVKKPSRTPDLTVSASEEGVPLKAWGTTFNELDWDTFLLLTRDEQDEIMRNLFAPDGDLRFSRGRIGMNCNDYGRSWFSCDEVPGDLELRHFNIDRDKTSIIPLIRAAQKYRPDLACWASPWSPPSWMKINGDYPVVSSRYNNADPKVDYLLYGTVEGIDEDEMKFLGERNGKFPRRLATQDYFIQDPRYLRAYAEYFCRFIDEYAAQGVPVDMVIFQNEPYSYTPYPGCPWTAEGTIRFNRDYLSPALRKRHPEVKLYLGTFNTNRQDHVEKILSDPGLREAIDGVAFQWEGREILPEIRRQYPQYSYICSESECGNGSMDWNAGQHTFFLISDNMGNGVDEWYNWNFLLPKEGLSPWGWKQNALIEVDPEARTFRYTPEYYAVKHFSHFIAPGARMVGYMPRNQAGASAIVYRTADGHHIIVAGNTADTPSPLTVSLPTSALDTTLPPRSFNTFIL